MSPRGPSAVGEGCEGLGGGAEEAKVMTNLGAAKSEPGCAVIQSQGTEYVHGHIMGICETARGHLLLLPRVLPLARKTDFEIDAFHLLERASHWSLLLRTRSPRDIRGPNQPVGSEL